MSHLKLLDSYVQQLMDFGYGNTFFNWIGIIHLMDFWMNFIWSWGTKLLILYVDVAGQYILGLKISHETYIKCELNLNS